LFFVCERFNVLVEATMETWEQEMQLQRYKSQQVSA
jgi:hypothetical protein